MGAGAVVLGLVVLLLPLMAASPRSRERRALVIQAVMSALTDAKLTPKDAQYFMEMDKSQWSRSVDVNGDLQLSVFKLALMPIGFQVEYIARYTFLVIRQSALDVAEDVAGARHSA